MTSGDHNLQDAELDEFLGGRDELSQQLAALAQPEAPKQVNDAIMASIAAQLAQEQATKAAPAPQLTSVMPRPAANMARWRAPAALAASLIGALLLTLEWQRGDYAQQAAMSAQQQQQPAVSVPQPPSADAPAPSSAPAKAAPKDVAPAQQPAPQAIPSQQQSASPRSRPTAELAHGPAPVQPAPITSPAPAAPPMPLMPQAPLMLAESAATAPLPAAIAPPAGLFLRSAPAPVIAGRMAASAPAPSYVASAATAPTVVSVTGAARKAEAQAEAQADATRAANWLHVIDEMLKAGLRNDAQEEWRKFRLAYPDYPVPEQLAKRIDATD
jgi:hypothetical protein